MTEAFSDDSLDFDVDSSEDTEDASETDQVKYDEMKVDCDNNKVLEGVQGLRELLRQLNNGTLPGYVASLAKIQEVYNERIARANVEKDLEIKLIDRKYDAEIRRINEETESKKIDLKDSLLANLEEKKKTIEAEHISVELTGAPLDTIETRPSFTRKLRRRHGHHDPDVKQNKASVDCRVSDYKLTETDIEDDLIQILPPHKADKIREKRAAQISFNEEKDHDRTINDIKVEDGRLFYDRKWYGRYQNVFVECKEFGKIPAVIQSVCSSDIVLKKTTDSSKLKITMSQLQKGKYSLKRRC